MATILLGSGSPRRRELLSNLGLAFEVLTKPTDESYPLDLAPEAVPRFLSEKKAAAFTLEELAGRILVTADTVVILDGEVINKPADEAEAKSMLGKLSGRTHQVITAFCVRNGDNFHVEADEAKVTFKALTAAEIAHYVENYHPLDKAGAYGAQDWIGMVGVHKIEGSFFTVMGLPTHKLYSHLVNLG